MNEHTATEVAYKNGYQAGVTDGIHKMQEQLKRYYESLNGKTYSALVAYHIDKVAQELLEEDTE